MSVGEGFGKTLGIGVLAAAAIGALWLFKDKIAGWFTSTVTQPVVGAVSGAVAAVSDVANTPILQIPSGDVTVGDVVSGVNPLTMIATLPGTVMGMVGSFVAGLGSANGESYEPVIAPTASVSVPTEANILWQAAMSEVGPAPTIQDMPSGYQVRGTSLTGAPLFEPVQRQLGYLDLPDAPGTVAEVWQLGPSKMLKIGDVWLGENISSCYLSGGWWDAPRGRCIYGAG